MGNSIPKIIQRNSGRITVILVVFWIVLAFATLLTSIPVEITIGSATVVLAILTYFSISQSEKTVKQMQKDREKPGIIQLIGYELDPFLDRLNKDKYQLSYNESKKYVPLRKIDLWTSTPDDRILDEFESQYPNIRNDLEIYQRIVAEYSELRSELLSDLDQRVMGEIQSNLNVQSRKALEELIEDENLNSDTSEELIESKSRSLAKCILRGESDAGTYTPRIWENVSDSLEVYREQWESRFAEVESKFHELQGLNQSLVKGCEIARQKWISQYEIHEPEIVMGKSGEYPNRRY